MKVQELINFINGHTFYSLYECEDNVPLASVAQNIAPDKRRWHETSVNVYKCDDGFVGVRGVSRLYFAHPSYEDIEVSCFASEYQEKITTTYVPKDK